MTNKIVTFLESIFDKAETTVEAAYQATASAVETAIKTAVGQDLPAVITLADKSVTAAALAGGTAETKWAAAWAIFDDGLKALNLGGLAVNIGETILQMAVTKLESTTAAPAAAAPAAATA